MLLLCSCHAITASYRRYPSHDAIVGKFEEEENLPVPLFLMTA